jgi:FeS assembly protein IscX
MTRLLKMVLKLPGFQDPADDVGEEQLEKLQLAWHDVQSA